MHLSLDTINMVDDGCLSSDNYHDLGKGGGPVMGGRVHSIDVILGFSKDQDPLLNSVGPVGSHKLDSDVLGEQGKQMTSDPYTHLQSLADNHQQVAYHGEEFLHSTFKTCYTPHMIFTVYA